MSMESLLAIAGFTIVVSLAPGPNNLMLAAAANFHSDSRAQPMSFAAAAVFQYVNRKAWLMGITAVSAFLPTLGGDWAALGLLFLMP